jgi:hypothetical protein
VCEAVAFGAAEVVFWGSNGLSGGDGEQSQVTPTSASPAVPGRRVVSAGNRGTGCSLVLERLQHVESRRSAGGEDGGSYSGHHREQDEPGELLAR